MDVDGVLTDAGMYYSQKGDELKKFSTYDGMAMELLREKGVKTAIITSEDSKIVQNRATKIKIDFVFQGIDNKLIVANELCNKENISLESEVSFIGDDINDFDLLNLVKYRACPANSMKKIKNIDGIHLMKNCGGNGAVREFVELLIDKDIINGR